MVERNPKRGGEWKLSWVLFGPPALIVLLAVISSVVYRPDRPIPTIVPGSSAGPAFAVQIIRPRAGLPLGGILPPQLFGLDKHLGFDSKSKGAFIQSAAPTRIEFGADGWELDLAFDPDGRVLPETQVTFDLIFEDEVRRLRCQAGTPAVGEISTAVLNNSTELSGSFSIEIADCVDARTGTAINWPPVPLVLHGSFDRLIQKDPDAELR